jgi:hypothetical protein
MQFHGMKIGKNPPENPVTAWQWRQFRVLMSL